MPVTKTVSKAATKAAAKTKVKAATKAKPRKAATKKTAETLLAGAEHLVGVNLAKARKPMTAEQATVLIDKGALLAGKLEQDLTPFQRVRVSSAILSIMDRLRQERLEHLDLSEEEKKAVKLAMFEIVTMVREKMQLAYA